MAQVEAFMAGVADISILAGSDLLLESKTLVDSSISIAVTAEEIRAGKGAKLIGRYFHTSQFSIELNDSVFQLDYIAMNVGSVITQLGADYGEYELSATADGTITVDGTPTDFLSYGTIGWYAPVGSNVWTTFTFDTGTNTATGVAGITAGQKYCIRYMNNSQCEEVIIPADFVPGEVTLIMKADLFKASKGEGNDSKSKVGKVEIEVPRFQLNGNMDLTLNMTGASQTPLSGQALATVDGSAGCESSGYYSKIRQVYFDTIWQDNVQGLGFVPNDEIEVAVGSTASTSIFATFKTNTAAKKVDPTELTYTVADSAIATVTNGIVTGVSAGTTTVTVGIKPVGSKTYPDITTQATITVS